MKNNSDIRAMAKEHHVKMWEIADALGIHESTFMRWMRKELPSDIKDKAIAFINNKSEVD